MTLPSPAGDLTGVVLMTYGSPRDLDDVAAYMTAVRGGRAPTDDLVAEFQRRYAVIGLSPLVRITEALAEQLEQALGGAYVVAAGMRFSEPSLSTAVQTLASRGARRLLGLVLSPQYSPLLMEGYPRALQAAAEPFALPTHTIGAWHLAPGFIQCLASRLAERLAAIPAERRKQTAVLMSAHSLPKRVVDREPDYVEQLKETARRIASAAGLGEDDWFFVYQSAGHSPEEWLKPDLLDLLPELARQGYQDAIISPVQFLADHLETLYDIDVAAREQALNAGFQSFARVPAPNADADFAQALAQIVRDEAAAWQQAEPAASGAAR